MRGKFGSIERLGDLFYRNTTGGYRDCIGSPWTPVLCIDTLVVCDAGAPRILVTVKSDMPSIIWLCSVGIWREVHWHSSFEAKLQLLALPSNMLFYNQSTIHTALSKW